jgi:hypothetical protein
MTRSYSGGELRGRKEQWKAYEVTASVQRVQRAFNLARLPSMTEAGTGKEWELVIDNRAQCTMTAGVGRKTIRILKGTAHTQTIEECVQEFQAVQVEHKLREGGLFGSPRPSKEGKSEIPNPPINSHMSKKRKGANAKAAGPRISTQPKNPRLKKNSHLRSKEQNGEELEMAMGLNGQLCIQAHQLVHQTPAITQWAFSRGQRVVLTNDLTYKVFLNEKEGVHVMYYPSSGKLQLGHKWSIHKGKYYQLVIQLSQSDPKHLISPQMADDTGRGEHEDDLPKTPKGGEEDGEPGEGDEFSAEDQVLIGKNTHAPNINRIKELGVFEQNMKKKLSRSTDPIMRALKLEIASKVFDRAQTHRERDAGAGAEHIEEALKHFINTKWEKTLNVKVLKWALRETTGWVKTALIDSEVAPPILQQGEGEQEEGEAIYSTLRKQLNTLKNLNTGLTEQVEELMAFKLVAEAHIKTRKAKDEAKAKSKVRSNGKMIPRKTPASKLEHNALKAHLARMEAAMAIQESGIAAGVERMDGLEDQADIFQDAIDNLIPGQIATAINAAAKMGLGGKKKKGKPEPEPDSDFSKDEYGYEDEGAGEGEGKQGGGGKRHGDREAAPRARGQKREAERGGEAGDGRGKETRKKGGGGEDKEMSASEIAKLDKPMADTFFTKIISVVCLRPRAMEEQSQSKIKGISYMMARKMRERSYSRTVARATIKRIQGCDGLEEAKIEKLIDDICKAGKE